jgi:exodeoxyribonuclease VIII
MYSEAYEKTFNERPDFLFLMVSDTIDCGRYPVRVQPLEDEWKATGFEDWHRDLRRYHQCKINNDWHDMNPITRPYWAKRKAA